MAERGHRAGAATVRVSASVALVLALAGLLFTANARLASEKGTRESGDLAQLVASEDESVRELAARAEGLRTEVDELTAGLATPIDTGDSEVERLTEIAAGRTAVAGPGLTVVLSDAPADAPRPPGVHPDDLVVHQQDIEGVINALWSGGAEAMAIQDQRVVATTAVRCVGNVLLLHGQVHSPPYTIRAIGDPDDLRAALDASATVLVYREWAEAVGLGWSVSSSSRLELPGYEGATGLRHARVPEGVDVFASGPSGGGR